MSYSQYEVTLAGLLHDIGKLLQRAFERPEEVAGQGYDLASTLCPVSRDGRYTHRHVLFTEAFFESMVRQNLHFPKGVNFDVVRKLACYHHKPDGCDFSAAAAWLCALGDRYSAGMDRSPEEDQGQSGKAFRTIPLRCIFDELILDEKELGRPQPHAYQLDLLRSGEETNLIPVAWPRNGRDEELPRQYRKVWETFQGDYTALARIDNLSFQLFEEALLSLLERTTWAIPSSTVDLPDISLYDHARTTAAIAACLHRYHEAHGELDNEKAIKDGTRPKFRFLAGDLSGIQGTLLNLASEGVRGVNKILRARSHMLGAIAEAATLQLTEALKIPLCSVVQQAGGRFLILVPAVEEADSVVEACRRRWDPWLLANFTGTLALNLAFSPAFAGEDFNRGRLSTVMASLGQAIEEAKQHPLRDCPQGVVKRQFPLDRACSACGARPAEEQDGDEFRCPTCQKEVELGGRLVRADLIAWGRDLPEKYHPVQVLDLDLALLGKDVLLPVNSLLSVCKARSVDTVIPWGVRQLANHIPIFRDAYELQDPRYHHIQEEPPAPGEPKTFMHLAAEALEFEEQNQLRGKPYLGLLKADVDYLGFLFHYGLQCGTPQDSLFSLSRLAQLSRMMDLYFTGYLKGLLQREFPNTYTVYAGGDDLLLIGPWRQTLGLAQRINTTFRAYTGHNPNITLSAGVTLLKPNYPVNRAVQEAEAFLERTKQEGRNRICAMISRPLPWERYAERLADAEWVHERMHDQFPVSTGFVYRIMEIARDVEAAAQGDVRKAQWRAHLAYHLARNIKASSATDKKRKMVEWLEHLGLDDHLKLTRHHSNLYEWRLPLAIALYRNRQ